MNNIFNLKDNLMKHRDKINEFKLQCLRYYLLTIFKISLYIDCEITTL